MVPDLSTVDTGFAVLQKFEMANRNVPIENPGFRTWL